MRVHQQAAFVLINRPYSESSWIIELFTREYGRLAVIAKGARRLKSRLRGILLPFQPLAVSWSGKNEVPTLTAAEIRQTNLELFDQELRGEALICGFYCNELMYYLLHRYDPHPALFDAYQHTLDQLHQTDTQLPRHLRAFEQTVIRETGYAVNFLCEANSKTAIRTDTHYYFQPGEGFIPCEQGHPEAVRGRVIMSLHSETEPSRNSLNAQEVVHGKRLMRAILRQSLGHKKIHSRALFLPTS